MTRSRQLAPCLIDRGTVSELRDMLRALETLEGVEYTYTVHGVTVGEGKGTLVKLMADPDSSTMTVNGCLFLNVMSFRYLDFEPAEGDRWHFTLHGDGATLEILSVPDESESGEGRRLPFIEVGGDDLEFVSLDDDEVEE